jgi:hypothetical protein
LVAVSVLPISKTSIRYGSADAGRSVHCGNELQEIMKQAGVDINLKEHIVTGKFVCLLFVCFVFLIISLFVLCFI